MALDIALNNIWIIDDKDSLVLTLFALEHYSTFNG